MSFLIPLRIDDAIAELQRERRMRKNVYPRLITLGKLTPARAEKQNASLDLAIKMLIKVKLAE